MPQHLIIDGYNLLGAGGFHIGRNPQEMESVRDLLVQSLSRYAQRTGHRITLVFDAWRRLGSPGDHQHRAGLTVVFTRSGERADQVIQRLIREFGREGAIVSSDHEIMATAQDYGALIIRAHDFWHKLQASQNPATWREGKAGVGSKEDMAADVPRNPKKGNPRKLSKAQRRRIRSLRKF